MAGAGWSRLRAELAAVRDRGRPRFHVNLNGDRWTATDCPVQSTVIPGHPLLHFPSRDYEIVRRIVGEAYRLACATAPPIAADIASAVHRRSGLDVPQALAVQDWPQLFGYAFREGVHVPPRFERAIHRDFLDGGNDDDADGLSRFHALAEELLSIFAMAERLPASGPSPDQEYWSVEEAAAMLGIKPQSLRKQVCEYRAKHGGRDPSWVKRRQGQIRGFLIHAPTYRLELRASRRRISREG